MGVLSVYYHGGVPGLHVGERILPPRETGAATTADYGDGRHCRRDRVYATSDLQAARVFAALSHVAGGDVYEVELVGQVEPDGDYLGPSEDSVMAPAAQITRVVERRVERDFALSELHKLAGSGALRSPDKPGRNEPCSCGSGVKFKKCCGP